MGVSGQLLLSLRDIMTSVLFYCAIRGIDTPLDMSMKLPKQEEEKKEESAVPEKAVEEKAPEAEKPADDEDDIDLFGSDDEDDAEIEAERNRLLAESQAKKKKKGVIAKSSVCSTSSRSMTRRISRRWRQWSVPLRCPGSSGRLP